MILNTPLPSSLHWGTKCKTDSIDEEASLREICEMLLIADAEGGFKEMRTVQGSLAIDQLVAANKALTELLLSHGHKRTLAVGYWAPQVLNPPSWGILFPVNPIRVIAWLIDSLVSDGLSRSI